jgi:hypothetical protein
MLLRLRVSSRPVSGLSDGLVKEELPLVNKEERILICRIAQIIPRRISEEHCNNEQVIQIDTKEVMDEEELSSTAGNFGE